MSVSLVRDRAQAAYDEFIKAISEAPGFNDQFNGLCPMLEALMASISNPAAFWNQEALLKLCTTSKSRRWLKDNNSPAVARLLSQWGATTNDNIAAYSSATNYSPSTRTATTSIVPHPLPVMPLPVVAPPVSGGLSKLLPDQGHGTMTGEPYPFCVSKWPDLVKMFGFAVGDATTFGGDAVAKGKETALYADSKRRDALAAANAIGGAKKHFRQSELGTVFTKTNEAAGGICTTFALAVAHVLTGGMRQTGTVRVEIVGLARGLTTHMFIICGRRGNKLSDLTSWGTTVLVVDLWWANLSEKANLYWQEAAATDWRLKEPEKLGQFYDNARADPDEEDRGGTLNKASLQYNQLKRELDGKVKALADLPGYVKEGRAKLEADIATLRKHLGLP